MLRPSKIITGQGLFIYCVVENINSLTESAKYTTLSECLGTNENNRFCSLAVGCMRFSDHLLYFTYYIHDCKLLMLVDYLNFMFMINMSCDCKMRMTIK